MLDVPPVILSTPYKPEPDHIYICFIAFYNYIVLYRGYRACDRVRPLFRLAFFSSVLVFLRQHFFGSIFSAAEIFVYAISIYFPSSLIFSSIISLYQQNIASHIFVFENLPTYRKNYLRDGVGDGPVGVGEMPVTVGDSGL